MTTGQSADFTSRSLSHANAARGQSLLAHRDPGTHRNVIKGRRSVDPNLLCISTIVCIIVIVVSHGPSSSGVGTWKLEPADLGAHRRLENGFTRAETPDYTKTYSVSRGSRVPTRNWRQWGHGDWRLESQRLKIRESLRGLA